jgi:hypothetical protein
MHLLSATHSRLIATTPDGFRLDARLSNQLFFVQSAFVSSPSISSNSPAITLYIGTIMTMTIICIVITIPDRDHKEHTTLTNRAK